MLLYIIKYTQDMCIDRCTDAITKLKNHEYKLLKKERLPEPYPSVGLLFYVLVPIPTVI